MIYYNIYIICGTYYYMYYLFLSYYYLILVVMVESVQKNSKVCTD